MKVFTQKYRLYIRCKIAILKGKMVGRIIECKHYTESNKAGLEHCGALLTLHDILQANYPCRQFICHSVTCIGINAQICRC